MNRCLSKPFWPTCGLLLVLAAAGLRAADSLAPAEWPQWRGPQRNGLSRETGLRKAWPAEGPPLLWTATGCGTGFSSVAVKDGLIYTAGTIEKKTCLLAFDLSGRLQWKATNAGEAWQVPADKKDWAGGFGGSRSTPTVNDGLVYHLQEQGRLAAFDARSGKEAWAVDLRREFAGQPNEWGYSESVLVDGAKVICTPGGKKAFLAALDKKTGQTLWTNADVSDPLSNSSPILVEDQGVRQIITMSSSAVLGFEADAGKLLWRHPHVNRYQENCETPLYQNGLVLISSGYRKGAEGLKLTCSPGQVLAEKAWSNPAADNLHGGPILLDGYLYAAGYDCRGWYCLETATGKEQYRQKDIGRSALTYADGRIYALEENGTMRLIDPSPKEFKVVSQFKLPKGGAGLCLAHPVVCGGRLYIRHGDCLYAYDLRAP